MDTELVAGIDIGTTTLKIGVFDRRGTIVAQGESGYAIDRPRSEWAEQDARAWARALDEALHEVASHVDRIVAIGICGQVNTHVFVDRDLRPLRPAILWQDQRCSQVAEELSAAAGSRLVGATLIDASSLLARAEWVRRNEPRLWARTAYILSPKDYLASHLCRITRPATDPISPIGLVNRQREYDSSMLTLVDGLSEKMPPLQAFDAQLGFARGAALRSLADAIVVTGTMDAWGNLYGSGVVDHGDAMEVAGTSEILGILSSETNPLPGVVSFLPIDGLYLHAGPTQAGGAALRWFAEVAKMPIQAIIDAAADAPPGAGRLIFLPHLLGERAPLWDSDARGAFIGLSSDHGLPELGRAVLEGVAYSARHLLEELEVAAGVKADSLSASGGGSRSDLWCQIKSDVLNRQLARLRVRHSGCLGAALLAASGAGFVDSVRTAAGAMVSTETVFEPSEGRGVYDELYELYRDLYHALAPTHSRLADMRRNDPLAARLSEEELRV
jgi:xylulokinase